MESYHQLIEELYGFKQDEDKIIKRHNATMVATFTDQNKYLDVKVIMPQMDVEDDWNEVIALNDRLNREFDDMFGTTSHPPPPPPEFECTDDDLIRQLNEEFDQMFVSC